MKIFGIVCQSEREDAIDRYVRAAAQVMRHDAEVCEEYIVAPNAGVVVIKHRVLENDSTIYRDNRSNFMAVNGHIVDIQFEQAAVGEDHNVWQHDNNAIIFKHFNKGNEPAFDKVNGAFVLAHWNSQTRSMTVTNDRYGFMPLYYYHDKEKFIFASEVKTILRVVQNCELNWQACASFFYMGMMVGEETLFKNIHTMASGQTLTYSNGRLTRKTYYDFAGVPVLKPEHVSIDKVADLFVEAVRKRIRHDKPNTLLLSGGFDSRLILGAFDLLGVTPRIVSLAHADEHSGADGEYARRIAESLGLECDVRQPKGAFLASMDAVEAFYILDGMTPTWHVFIGEVYSELSHEMGFVWDGLGLDIGLGGSYQTEAGAQHDLQRLLEQRSRNRTWLRLILHPWLFKQIDSGFTDRMQQELDKLPKSENQFLHFILKNRTRRRIAVNPYQLFASKVEPITPGIDSDFLNYVLSIPLRLRRHHRLYIDLIKSKFPALMNVPIISGGSVYHFDDEELIKATRTGKLANFRRRFGEASRLLTQRLRKRIGKNAEQNNVSSLVVSILQIKNFDRPIYNKVILRALFSEYRKGNELLHELFLCVFYIELWHLLFLDRDSPIFFNSKNVEHFQIDDLIAV